MRRFRAAALIHVLLAALSVFSLAEATSAQVCLLDENPADFAAGTNSGTATGADVSLAPGVDESFTDPGLPAGWTATEWNPGGTGAAAGGALVVNGAFAATNATYAPGRTLEFTATFASEPYQHVGFAVDLNAPPWAIFSTGGDGAAVSARSHNGSAFTDTVIPLAEPFVPHVFRIVWGASEIQYYVDGALVVSHGIAIATPMRAAASDYLVSGNSVSVDSLRLSPPHVPAGTFSSRIADSGQLSSWGVAEWTSDTPSATSLAISVRTGDTPTPDTSWSAFAPVALSGDSVGQLGRYAQYRAEFATSDVEVTPRLLELSVSCVAACGDGVLEGAEECDDSNTLPGDGCSATCQYESPDADGDGILNGFETATGIYVSPTDTGTNPLVADSDDDGFCDGPLSPGTCVAGDTCPVVGNAGQENADGDGLGDACDACPLDAANDADGDLVCGNVDNCPTLANAGQANADGDGAGDVCDACPLDALNDVDGDLVCGDVDNCPVAPNPAQTNADGDGLGDACDACPLDALNDVDGDLVCGDVDNCPVAPNAGQANADGDGAGDVCDACPLDALNDVDGDLVCGNVDNCPVAPNAGQANADGDAAGDACDACPLDALNDLDGDAACGDVDNCPVLANADQLDGDADLRGDVCDNCPLAPNAGQTNADGDAAGDACDACPLDAANDGDGDLVCGDVDNCPLEPNIGQGNADADALGDACDACPLDAANDIDVDLVCGNVDNCPLAPNAGQANADGDAAGDVCDACPLDALNDLDGDAACGDVDNCPVLANPDQLDGDADLRGDVCDNCPLAPNAGQENTDSDGLGDACDACPLDAENDVDTDLVCGNVDNCPLASNAGQQDSDGDGPGDACDACPLDAQNDVDTDLVCGNVDNCPSASNTDQLNSDGDAAGDACDACPLDAANDIDGDLVCGDVDNCPVLANANQLDGDVDLRGDACDNCAAIANPAQQNADLDTLGDACDPCPQDAANDVDGDLLCGDVDNCPAVANAGQEDLDLDAVGDACDNCLYASNSGQQDTGGVFASSPDGIGDACQCGDVSDAVHAGPDGGVNTFDGDEMRLFLAGVSTLPAAALVERCSVDGATGACTVLDWVRLARAEALVEPSLVAQVCRPAVCLVDPSDLDGDCLLGVADLCSGWPSSTAEQAQDANLDLVPDACQCGDLDRDGGVDSDDETWLTQCLGSAAVCDASLADFDRDGDVDVADFAIYEVARDASTFSSLECTRRLGPAGP